MNLNDHDRTQFANRDGETVRDHRRCFATDDLAPQPTSPGEIDDEDDGNWCIYR